MSNAIDLPDPDTAWWRCTGADLARTLQDLETLRCRVEAIQGRVLAEVESRGVFAEYGYSNLESWQRHVLRIGWREGRKRAARAGWLNETRDAARVIAPLLPQVAEAFADGAINTAHVDEIAAVFAEFPGTVPAADRAGYEKILVTLARDSHPGAVKRAGQEILDRLNPDGKKPRDKDRDEPDRELFLWWSRDHVLKLKGRLDTETGQLLRLNPFATAQDAADSILGPPSPKVNWETPISAEAARRMACDARIIPAVLGSNGEVLDLGRAVRTATPAQRRALALRDRGCVMDGCTRPVRWTQVHHINEWTAHQGPSDLANMCLVCAEDHRLIHHGGWTIRMAPDGHPECIPPAWLDPHQRPRRNTATHLDPYLNTS